MSLYGTRDAAANFQRTVREFMERGGWVQSKYCPCSFQHPKKDLLATIHGDDFVVVGDFKSTAWFKKELMKRFDVRIKIVGSKGIMDYEGIQKKSWADIRGGECVGRSGRGESAQQDREDREVWLGI